MRITHRETSSNARWSLRLALFTAQLIIVTVLLHRFATLPTPIATNLVVVSLLGAAVAILLALLAFIRIWNTGIKGTGIALSGLLLSFMIFAVPLYSLPSLIFLPAINDITTDLLSPPQFRKVASIRDVDANSTNYPGAVFIEEQAKAYPDISTLMLERSNLDSFVLVQGVIQDLGWQVIDEHQPSKKAPIGYIEAVDKSSLLGFKDDIVVRIRGNLSNTRIDMRSASRYGRHDLGANAKRIRNVFAVIKTRIARAEAKRIDRQQQEKIAKRILAEKKRKERERKIQKTTENNEDGPIMLPKARFNEVGIEGDKTAQSPKIVSRSPGSARSGNASSRTARPTQRRASKPKTQKIRKSKRKRRKKWIPFELP